MGRYASREEREMPANVIDPPYKLSISSLEGSAITVTAMFNPKEVQIDRIVPWSKAPIVTGDLPSLQFSSAEGRVMSFELLFDGFETGTNVHTTFIQNLTRLAAVQDANGPEDKRRPPKVSVKWAGGRIPDFQGVIEEVSTRYTMFLADGTPVRATCRLVIREASHVSVRKS